MRPAIRWRPVFAALLALVLVGIVGGARAEDAIDRKTNEAYEFIIAGRSDVAKPMLASIVDQLRRKGGAGDAQLARALRGLARAQIETNEPDKAIEGIKAALAILARIKAEKRDFLEVKLELGDAYLAAKRTKDASGIFVEIIDEGEKDGRGVLFPVRAAAHESLGKLAADADQNSQASVHYEKALGLLEVEGAPLSEDALRVLGLSCGNEFHAMNAEKAETCTRRWLKEAESVPDAPQSSLLRPTLLMSLVYLAQEKYAEALPYLARSAKLIEASDGPASSTTVVAYSDLAKAQLMLRAWDDARETVRKIIGTGIGDMESDESIGFRFRDLASLLLDGGLFAEAAELNKISAEISERLDGEQSPELVARLGNLGFAYKAQGRIAEAEKIYLRAIALAERYHRDDVATAAILSNNLGQLYREQGARTLDKAILLKSEARIERALQLLDGLAEPEPVSRARYLGNLATTQLLLRKNEEAKGNLTKALEIHDTKLGGNDPTLSTVLLPLAELSLSGRQYAEAEKYALRAIAAREPVYGPLDSELEVLWSIASEAQVGLGRLETAHRSIRTAVDIIVRRLARVSLPQYDTDFAGSEYFTVFDVAISVNRIWAQREPGRLAELREEAFELAQRAMSASTSAALVQAAARSAADSRAAQAIIRQRQDLLVEITALDDALLAEVSGGAAPGSAERRKKLREDISAARARMEKLDAAISNEAPGYGDLVVPHPLKIAEVQSLLHSGEVLILLQKRNLWAVSQTEARWLEVALSEDDIETMVGVLRCGLDTAAWRGEGGNRCGAALRLPKAPPAGSRLPFDTKVAHDLYAGLFGEIEDMTSGKRLIVVTSGALTSLPLHVLVTKPPPPAQDQRPGAPIRKDIAWLTRSSATVTLPSVLSLKALRQNAKASTAPRPFVGFGSPVLLGPRGKAGSISTCAEASAAESAAFVSLGLPELPGSRPGIEDVRKLPPVPSTAAVLCDIAGRLGIPESEIHLGDRARESEVKQLSEGGALAKYRVVQFATHGLVAGELKGLGEPALVLTPPPPGTADARALDIDNGLLTASEVARLKLDADWVILSACNTAAADKLGAESLSGLARAFFYAGARALLVSHWSVDARATVTLIRGTFDAMRAAPDIGRSEAVRRAMAAMIDGGAPPSDWAPFVVVGEGAGARS
jgi:CHAT domain-containing protein/tetratricopeptide (TPR) repeat protein